MSYFQKKPNMRPTPFVIFLLIVALLSITDCEPEFAGATASKRHELSSASPEPKLLAGQELSGLRSAGEPEESFEQTLREIDSTKALNIAQRYDGRGMWESAAKWYLTALEWNPASPIAAEGFVLSSFNLGRHAEVYQTGSEMESSSPAVKRAVLRGAIREAENLLRENREFEARQLLDRFPESETAFAPLRARLHGAAGQPPSRPPQPSLVPASVQPEAVPRPARLMQGWNLYHLGRYAEAAGIFEKLFNNQADKEAARGLVYSLRSLGDTERLGRLIEKWGGFLAEESGDTAH